MFKIMFKNLNKKQWLSIAIMIALIILQVFVAMQIPNYLSNIFRAVRAKDSGAIWRVGGIMLLFSVAEALVIVAINFITSRLGAGLAKTLREKLFKIVQSFSMEEMSNFSTASLITRCTNDIQNVQMTITMSLRMIITAPLMAISAIFMIFTKNRDLSLVTCVAVVVLIIVIIVCVAIAMPKFKHIQKLTDKINMVTRESLTGIRVIRAFNTEGVQETKFDEVNDELTGIQKFVNRIIGLIFPSMNFIIHLLTLAIVWIGSYILSRNGIEIEVLTTFSQYAVQVLMSFLMLSMMFVMIPRAMVSAGRINDVMDTKVKILPGNITESNSSGSITFNNVGFKYPNGDENVLENINLDIKPGETCAFIGSTGSGKSTLINLIPRFFDTTSGEVIVDDINVKDYTLDALRSKIGYISQKTLLFSGTIRENLLDGNPNATDEDMWHALKLAQAKDFVEKLDGELDYNLSQGATNVSGGQKQRLSIARAIIGKPEILIFDDSFSALDFKTDQKLRKALKSTLDKTTTLIVGQRIGTIMHSDKIVVLDEGKIVGIGTHKELLDNCKVYREIAYSQLNKEELENA